MTKLEYRVYLESAHWQDTRIRKLICAEFTCEDCGGRDLPLEIHHLHYYSLYRERMADLACCCRECHQQRHEPVEKLIERRNRSDQAKGQKWTDDINAMLEML